MSRLKISLKSSSNNLKIPFNYNHILSAIIYNKIDDLDLAYKLHSSQSFKFFTFSQLNISKKKMTEKGFISRNGKISFFISSPNDYLIKSLVNGFLETLEVNLNGQKLLVEEIELLKEPKFTHKMEFKALSPIIARTKREVDGNLKEWDLTPEDEFFKALEKNLIKKYKKYNEIEETDKEIKIYSEMKNVKRKRIAIVKGPQTTYHRAFMMDLILEGDLDLIKFAYDCGLGEKNSISMSNCPILNMLIRPIWD